MASTPAPSIQEVRSLAHKLYIQCCDSANAFKPLQKSVRSLRNELEEADEVLGQEASNNHTESRAVVQAAKCYPLLQQLDLAIQHHRGSADKASSTLTQVVIADFKAAIDAVTRDFVNACDTLKAPSETGELHLDTITKSALICRWPSSASQAPSMSKQVEDVLNRPCPSPPSLLSSCVSAPSSIADSIIEAHAAEEKEVLIPGEMLVLATTCTTQSCESFADVPSWRTPFAIVDPLSIPFEDATLVILEGEGSAPKRNPDSSPAIELLHAQKSSATDAVAADDHGSSDPDIDSTSPSCIVAPLRTRASSTQPPTVLERGLSHEARGESSAERRESHIPEVPSKTLESDAPSPDAMHQPEPASSRFPPEAQTCSPRDGPIPLWPAQPSRAPPPPPPTPRRSKTHCHSRKTSQGRYRIVNATPEEADSDDELYKTSRPTSIEIPHAVSASPLPATQTARKVSFADVVEIQITKSVSDEPSSSRSSLPHHSFSPLGIDSRPHATDSIEVDNNATDPPNIPTRPSRLNAQSRYLSKRGPQATSVPSRSKTSQDEVSINVAGGVRHPKSADEVLEIGSVPSVSPSSDVPPSIQLRSHGRSLSRAQREQEIWQRSELVHEFYGPVARGQDEEEEYLPQPGDVDLDAERLDCIVERMNSCSWVNAEPYLRSHLRTVVMRRDKGAIRRTRHLLGVCASFRGQPQEAINYFKTVIRTPVKDIADLDVGDCAAAYWLADAYAMLDRKAEALLAYRIAARSPMYQDPAQQKLQLLVTAEQESCEIGMSKSDLSTEWFDYTKGMAADGSLLHPNVLSFQVATELLDNFKQKPSTNNRLTNWLPVERLAKLFWLRSDQSRGFALHSLHTGFPAPPLNYYYRINLTPNMLSGSSEHWPMPYDPFFCMANVSRGRLLSHESDLLQTFAIDSSAQLPKSRSTSLTRGESVTHPSLPWLIRTTRQCLTELEIEYTEVAEPDKVRFACRYAFMQKKIATTHYFSIALVRPLVGSGHAIEIAGDGIASSRLAATGEGYENGVEIGQVKGLRQRIKETMEQQAKLMEAKPGNGEIGARKGRNSMGKALKKAKSVGGGGGDGGGGGQFAYRIAI